MVKFLLVPNFDKFDELLPIHQTIVHQLKVFLKIVKSFL